MSSLDMTRLEAALDSLPDRFRGPGGVAGVVKNGEIVATRAWGYADRDAHLPMTATTRMPICSISKQFTCGVLLDRIGDPDRLNARVADYLPNYTDPLPTVRQLCHNQSGLRDYWALTVLQGALAEQTFRREDALPLLARMKTGHFAPGTSYSYCNANFRIVSELIESETGEKLEDLYQQVIFGPAGMTGAVLAADTRHPVDSVVGYEGSDATGFMPADNGIYWIGDAGIAASLEDMLAYEVWIDATRNDPASLYNRLTAPPSFADGTPAQYGFGVGHGKVGGVATTGHGAGLRGFRAHRLHAAAERLSVFIHFNHEANAHTAAVELMRAALGQDEDPKPGPVAEDWAGQWLCPENGLLARIEPGPSGATLRYGTGPDTLKPGAAGLEAEGISITREGANLTMRREGENFTSTMPPLPPVEGKANGAEIAGRYHSDELGATMVIEARDGGVYAFFEGMLGVGRMERVHPVAKDTWIVVTRRSMDAAPPGDWTLSITRDEAGKVTGAMLGCWLARGVGYVKISG